jgi:hypothetical protein
VGAACAGALRISRRLGRSKSSNRDPDDPVAEVRGVNVHARQVIDGRDRGHLYGASAPSCLARACTAVTTANVGPCYARMRRRGLGGAACANVASCTASCDRHRLRLRITRDGAWLVPRAGSSYRVCFANRGFAVRVGLDLHEGRGSAPSASPSLPLGRSAAA